MEHGALIMEQITKLITSYGIFGIMAVLFVIGKIKKFTKKVLFLILIVGVIALFYGGYLTFDFMM